MQFSRIPRSVLYDKTLSASARVVYAAIAGYVWQGNTASLGHRKIARDLGISPTTALSALDELQAAKHLLVRSGPKHRGIYILTSPVFASKQRNGEREIGIGPSGNKRLVSVPRARIA